MFRSLIFHGIVLKPAAMPSFYNKQIFTQKYIVDFQELTKREAEYVSLSRDTTEADLKQRREIRSGSAFYLDQV